MLWMPPALSQRGMAVINVQIQNIHLHQRLASCGKTWLGKTSASLNGTTHPAPYDGSISSTSRPRFCALARSCCASSGFVGCGSLSYSMCVVVSLSDAMTTTSKMIFPPWLLQIAIALIDTY
jgi:hypothetical protein